MSLNLVPGHPYTAYPVGCRGTIDLVVDGRQVTLKPEGDVIKAGRIASQEILVEGTRLAVFSRGDRQVVVLSEGDL